MSELDSTIYRSDDTATAVAKFFAEYDRRIEGARGTPVDSSAALVAMRPILWAQAREDPEAFIETVWTVGARYVQGTGDTDPLDVELGP